LAGGCPGRLDLPAATVSPLRGHLLGT